MSEDNQTSPLDHRTEILAAVKAYMRSLNITTSPASEDMMAEALFTPVEITSLSGYLQVRYDSTYTVEKTSLATAYPDTLPEAFLKDVKKFVNGEDKDDTEVNSDSEPVVLTVSEPTVGVQVVDPAAGTLVVDTPTAPASTTQAPDSQVKADLLTDEKLPPNVNLDSTKPEGTTTENDKPEEDESTETEDETEDKPAANSTTPPAKKKKGNR